MKQAYVRSSSLKLLRLPPGHEMSKLMFNESLRNDREPFKTSGQYSKSFQVVSRFYLNIEVSSKITKRNVVYHKLPLTTIHPRQGFNLAGLLNGRAYIR